jgi:hypothetical protein
LAPADDQFLGAHLAACPLCRIVERDLQRQHGELARLGQPVAPRDLWARTSAALDREMARSPREQAQMRHRDELLATRPGASASRWLALSAVSSVTLAAIVVAGQLQTTVVPPPAPTAVVVPPTMFAVAPQDIALIDYSADGVAVYQARVSEVCPQSVPDCGAGRLDPSPMVELRGGSARSQGVALHSGDGRVAVVADDPGGGETVSVVDLPDYNPSDDRISGAAPTARPSPAVAATAMPTPLATRIPRATPAGATRPASVAPRRTKRPQQHATAAPTSTPTPKPARSTRSPRSTRPPTAATSTPARLAPTPASTAAPRRTPKPHHPSAGRTPAVAPRQAAPSLVPGRTQAPTKAALAIAEGVRLAGAMPAWSPRGDMLAFSATPADRSTGPDLYLWHVGDAQATRLTNDHSSYFASWDGDRIVVSRANGATSAGSSIDLVVFDTRTRTRRAVPDVGLWLPAVQPGGSFAIAWMGQLTTSGYLASPVSGHLYLIDWERLDPYRGGRSSGPTGKKPRATSPIGSTAPEASRKPRPSGAKGGDRRSHGPEADPSNGMEHRNGSGSRHSPSPTQQPKDLRKLHPGSTPPGDSKRPGNGKRSPRATPSPSIGPARDAFVLRALDANAGGSGAVVDWIVRWSDDGTAFGVWIADTPGGNWGRLTVKRLTSPSGSIANQPILGPNLARRTFSMSADRVAWIAPSDGSVDGELRVRTWGAQGSGDLRIPLNEKDRGVPAF